MRYRKRVHIHIVYVGAGWGVCDCISSLIYNFRIYLYTFTLPAVIDLLSFHVKSFVNFRSFLHGNSTL